MQTHLADWIRNTPEGIEADALLRSCVHCGFCNATCPTYQLLGDELDAPRGRIYLIKQVLEGAPATASTQRHLDRCLTCRNCETTCPSGVQYGRLLDIGRKVVDERLEHRGRSAFTRAARWLLKEGLTSSLFAPAIRLGQLVRPLLPKALKNKVPARTPRLAWPTRTHEHRMLMLAGCVQPAMAPNINAATARVLDALGVQTLVAPNAGCCGAVRQHLDDTPGALNDVRRNIDAWWPEVERGAQAIIINASGCAPMVKDYAHLLRFDPLYAQKAQRVSALAKDASEVIPDLLREHTTGLAPTHSADPRTRDRFPHPNLSPGGRGALNLPLPPREGPRVRESDIALSSRTTTTGPRMRVAFHPTCTLQHGQQIHGVVEPLLESLGAELLPFAESHLCCGSAGTYSVLQPQLAYPLRDRKLKHLQAGQPEVILSANVGCIAHLASGTKIPVQHWVEWVCERL